MGPEIKIIKFDELKDLIENKKNYILVDVRNKDELVFGVIPTSVNISLPEFEFCFDLNEYEFEKKFKFPKFKKDDNLIFYCRTGGRSNIAARMALNKGFINSRNYEGSIWEWSEHDPNVKRYGPGA